MAITKEETDNPYIYNGAQGAVLVFRARVDMGLDVVGYII
jgi:hypothetical protein